MYILDRDSASAFALGLRDAGEREESVDVIFKPSTVAERLVLVSQSWIRRSAKPQLQLVEIIPYSNALLT